MRAKKLLVFALFALYTAAAFYLLFYIRSSMLNFYTYGEYFRKNSNFVPFRTIAEFVRYYRADDVIYGDLSFDNLWGNLAVFMPAGVFFPALWKKQRSFKVFALTIAAVIIGVEAGQFLTMRGSCDIDDFILNISGAFIGFAFSKLNIVRKLIFTDIS
ncbi:VanZ family protein [Ruminococcus flavefaciens]|nr:VanZ family protein [Ruminococcus flavefaciens]